MDSPATEIATEPGTAAAHVPRSESPTAARQFSGGPIVGSAGINHAAHTGPALTATRPARAGWRWRGLSGTAALQGALSLADQLMVSGTSFATVVLVGRFCGAEELGLYSLGATLVLLATSVHTSLISLPLTVYGNRLQGAARAEYAGSVLVHQAGYTLLAMLGLAAAAAVASFGLGPAGLAPVMWTLAGTIGLLLLRELARRWAFAELRMDAALAVDALVTALQLGGLLWLCAAGRLAAATAYLAIAAACAAGGLAWLCRAWRRCTVRWSRVWQELHRSWTFGRWVFAGSITWMVQGYVVHWLLALKLGTAATGVFAACMTVVMFFNPLLVAVGNLVIPHAARSFAQQGPSGVQRVVAKATAVLATAMSAYCLLLMFVGDQVVQSLYHGSEYSGQGHLLLVLAFGLLASILSAPADNGLWTIERGDLSFWSNVLGLAATLALSWPLLSRWGLLGGAYGLLAGNIVASAARGVAFLGALRHAPQPSKS